MTTIAPTLRGLAHASGLSSALSRRKDGWRILMLHAVGGTGYPAPAFAEQMEYLASEFRVIPLDSAVQGMEEGRKGSGEVVLTFDDGLRNQAQVAYPILRRLGLPATFFVCPGLMEGGSWLWNHEARERLRLMTPGARGIFLSRVGAPAPDGDIGAAVGWMKSLALDRRREVEEALRRATAAFDPRDPERERYDLMSWEELSALDPGLITIGSHTMHHPILPTVDDASLASEIEQSRAVLESRLGRRVEFFCYPNGSYDRRAVERVRASYRAAVSVDSGFARPGADRHLLPRIAMPRVVASLAWRLHRPGRRPAEED